jgi:hypothetical protein
VLTVIHQAGKNLRASQPSPLSESGHPWGRLLGAADLPAIEFIAENVRASPSDADALAAFAAAEREQAG